MLVFVIGTRAQLVKMAPVIREAGARGAPFRIEVTAQHHESMLQLAEDLGVGDVFPAGSLGTERSSVLLLATWFPRALGQLWNRFRRYGKSAPDAVVLVHGDTASTLLGAIAARAAGLTLAHVESGLTSGALWTPFPEELIRRVVGRLSHIAFAPDEHSAAVASSRPKQHVVMTGGNTIIDALQCALSRAPQPAHRLEALVSLHRFENIMPGSRLSELVAKTQQLSVRKRVGFIAHPPTEKRLRSSGLWDRLVQSPGVEILPRMPYSAFMALAAASEVVVTDGGSNQEELSLLGVPTIVLRTRTERGDGLGANCVLEGELETDWVEYITSGRAAGMRRSPLPLDAHSPSAVILDALLAPGAGRAEQ